MTIQTDTKLKIVTIALDGEIDASNAIYLDKTLEKAFSSALPHIFLNCEKLEYISSAGLGVIMSYIQEVQDRSLNFIIYGLSEDVLEVFQILGLNTLLRIVSTKVRALELI